MHDSAAKPQTTAPLQTEVVPFGEWPEVVERIGMQFPSAGAAFSGSHAYISGRYILVDAKEIAFELLRDANKRSKIREIIAEVTGRQYSLGPYKGEAVKSEKKDENPVDKLVERAQSGGIEVEYEQ